VATEFAAGKHAGAGEFFRPFKLKDSNTSGILGRKFFTDGGRLK
jgi:hypothetical protein